MDWLIIMTLLNGLVVVAAAFGFFSVWVGLLNAAAFGFCINTIMLSYRLK